LYFFARGGLEQFQAFAESVTSDEDRKKGTTVIPTRQTGKGSIPIASGSQRTVDSIEVETILRSNVADKRKFSPMAEKPPIKVIFDNPRAGGNLDTQTGQIVGANLSVQKGQEFGTGQFGLNQKEVSEIRSRDFTDQEKQDIANLQLRFDRKTVSAQKVSDAPEEIIFKKREQEQIARNRLVASRAQGGFGANFTFSKGAVTRGGFVISGKGGLFGSADFALGGKSLEEFNADQQAKALVEVKQAENAILRQQRIESGEQVIQTIAKSGLNQKEFLRQAGFNLQGSDLSALALGKIQAGTIKSAGRNIAIRTVRPEVQPRTIPQLSSAQVFALSDAEKIARFRRGERFTWA